MDIELFDYDLPRSAIAQEPLPDRDGSRLLVLDRSAGTLSHRTFRELPELLRPGDLLVFNRSRVLPARLRGRRRVGGAAEILLARARGGGEWDALVRPGRRLKTGSVVDLGEGLQATVGPPSADVSAGAPLRRVVLRSPDGDPDAAIERLGTVPLPPYIRRAPGPADRDRYQTVYAREPGSVAAPTAGLHFSEALLARLDACGIQRTELVLHVGPGTFQPVKAARIEDHEVEPEVFDLPPLAADAIGAARRRGGRVVAVGTTTTRVLETCVAPERTVAPRAGETALAIVPGFAFRVVDALVTNFHLPRSSLLLLTAAFAGRERLLEAYREAVTRGYRFYSFGDASLIL